MTTDSKIEWTHHTFNPWRGCAKVHQGCTHCYAEKNVGISMAGIRWGEPWQGGQRVATTAAWSHPRQWARAAAKAGERHRVFCASLADVLEVPADPPESLRIRPKEYAEAVARVAEARATIGAQRDRLFDVILRTTFAAPSQEDDREDPRLVGYGAGVPDPWSTPGLDWLLLTKRPEHWPLIPEVVRPFVWLGTSVSDQETADALVPELLKAEGFRFRFLSVEPMLGPVNLRRYLRPVHGWWEGPHKSYEEARAAGAPHGRRPQALVHADARFVDWVIVGGESGTKARACWASWVGDVVQQCADAGTPCHVKQLGAVWAGSTGSTYPVHEPIVDEHGRPTGRTRVVMQPDTKGGYMPNWPEALRVRQYPRGVKP